MLHLATFKATYLTSAENSPWLIILANEPSAPANTHSYVNLIKRLGVEVGKDLERIEAKEIATYH